MSHCSTQGSVAFNERLGQQRLESVKTYLQSGGFTHFNDRIYEFNHGEQGAGEGEEWRRVDIECDGAMAQTVAAHEAGHMFGLGDEYTNQGIGGTGQPAGSPALHDQLSQDAGQGSAVHENNDNIMSLGKYVEPQHYSTFVYAIKQITGENSWTV